MQPYLSQSPPNYQQQYESPYWPESQPQNFETQPNHTPPQYDFNNFSSADLFQPEEIFQLDQPLRPGPDGFNNPVIPANSEIARSPPTLLDLGSGTIHREFKNEFWIHEQSMTNLGINDDSNTSSCSRLYFNQSPDSRDLNLNNNVLPLGNTLELDKMQISLENKLVNELNQTCTISNNKYNNKLPSEQFYHNSLSVSHSQTFEILQQENSHHNHHRLYYNEENIQNYPENFQTTDYKNYRYPIDVVRLQDKSDISELDIPQYVDYTNISYEGKVSLADNIEGINDIECRLQCNNAVMVPLYNNEPFETINMITNH